MLDNAKAMLDSAREALLPILFTILFLVVFVPSAIYCAVNIKRLARFLWYAVIYRLYFGRVRWPPRQRK
jgi:hypothetical protein